MPIEKRQPNIEAILPSLKIVRDCIAGSEVIKSKKNQEKYLPKINTKQNPAHYKRYLRMPIFFEATKRTALALSSIICKKPPIVEASDLINKITSEITITKQSFENFASDVTTEKICAGAQISCLDRNTESGKIYVAKYKLEDLYHYEFYNDDGVQKLKHIVLKEDYITKGDDDYSKNVSVQFREYKLSLNQQGNKQVIVRLFRIVKEKEFEVVETIPLLNKQEPLDFIPVEIIGISENQDLKKSVLFGLANANISHFESCAQLENISFWSSAPIPVITKDSVSQESQIDFNPGNLLILSKGETMDYSEVTGNGADVIRTNIKDKEQIMSSLGANIITPSQSTGVNIEVARMHQATSNATLLNISKEVGTGLTNLLKMISQWSGEDLAKTDKISVVINQDFVSSKITPAEIKALLDLYNSPKQAMSLETLIYNLSQGEVQIPNRTVTDEIDLINAENVDGGLEDLE